VENFTTGQYGIIHRIFHEIEVLRPNFTPRMILDFGSGPGTTVFAADEIWGENIIKHFLAVEPSSAMLDISQTLTRFDSRVLYRRFLSLGKEVADYDLVVSSCSFTYLQTPRERR
jgi:ribosomal protein RSM22 (predicted rRNA methylase)